MNRGRIIDIKENEKVLMANIHNKFEIEVIDVNTGKVKQRAQAFNTICNNLWTRLFAPNTYFNYIHYGTGSGAPTVNDTSLFSFLGYGSATQTSYKIDYKNGVCSRTYIIQLTASTAVGQTITEVGIAYDTGKSTLCTHAMLQDMNGNPVGLQKTDTDVFNIYATVYVHFNPKGYSNGCINFVTSNIFSWLTGKYDREYQIGSDAFLDQFGGLGFNSSMSRPSGYIKKGIATTYNSSDKTVKLTLARLEHNENPTGGIRSICTGYYYSSTYGASFRPALIIQTGDWFPYSEIENEAIGTGDGTTTEFAFDFGFVRDATIYIDGVAISPEEFTFDYGPLTTDNWLYHMEGFREELSTPSKLFKHYYNPTEYIKRNDPRTFYNPFYEIGLGSIAIYYYGELFASNDLVNWYSVIKNTYSSSRTYTIPEEYAHYKYWKCVNHHETSDTANFNDLKPKNDFTGSKLRFVNPPAEGAIITADYKTDCIAKNANNVFDFSLTIQVGEYAES